MVAAMSWMTYRMLFVPAKPDEIAQVCTEDAVQHAVMPCHFPSHGLPLCNTCGLLPRDVRLLL
jgi:hypothetical protein